MVPNVTKSGTSFKGAAAYYLHDKREAGEDVRTTNERVEWTATRGLATDDPDLAIKIMAATAMDQDRLKAEAGIKNTGRKSAESVYAYSLAWHPDEADKISKAEMLRAADESIRALGAEGHQAVIVAHNDEPQPHVHVILNRVSPENGKMLTKSNDFHKLESWALAYRTERGEEHKYCPARAEKADAIKKHKEGENVDFVRGEKSISRQHHEAAKGVHANDNDTAKINTEQKTKDAALAGFGKKMHSRHSHEWDAISANNKANKSAIKNSYKEQIKGTDKAIKEQFRPVWRELYKQQSAEKKAFEQREKRLMGKVKNTLAAVKHSKKLGRDDSHGGMSGAFNFMISAKARAGALEKLHASQRRELTSAQKQQIGAAIKNLKNARTADLKHGRQIFKSDRQVLIDKQAAEKADLSRKWSRRTSERKMSFDLLRRQDGIKKAGQSRTSRPVEAKSENSRGKYTKSRKQFRKAARGNRTRKARPRGKSP